MDKLDEELVKYIEEIIDNSNGDYCSAFDKVVEWRKKNRGLKGIHVSPPLDVMCSARNVEDPIAEANNVAKDALTIMLESAKGELKEVPLDELERM